MTPLRNVIAAVDFSDSSRRILVLAARIARKHKALLHVLASANVADLTATRDTLRRFVAEVPDVVSPCLSVIAGSPASTILNTAEREDADLVVMAADYASSSDRHLPGAVAQHVLLNARRSTLVVPSSWTPPAVGIGLAPIVVGVDATEPGLRAGRLAAELARTLDTTAEAVHVVSCPESPSELERLLHIVAPALDGLRVEVGDVVERLASVAAPAGLRRPLLVIGRRGHGGPEALPGSTAERLAALGTIPLLMYRPT